MGDITLSGAVRNNLLSLQNTANLLGKTQERLSTGLKVNSALDDPSSFFTAAALNNRASDLNRLLDSVGLAVQTIEAADQGITAITDLVEAAQASARQALQAPGPVGPGIAATVTGTGASVAADAAAVGTGTVTTIATDTAATSASSGTTIAGTDLLSSANAGTIASGDSLTITSSDGSFTSVSIAFDGSTSATGATLGVGTATIDNLITEINAQAGSTIASLVGGNLSITSPTGDIAIAGTNAAADINLASSTVTNTSLDAITAGQTLTFTTAAGSSTVTFGTGSGQSNSRVEVLAALNAGASGASFAFTSNTLVATAPNAAAGDITVATTSGASALTALGFTSGQVAETTNATLGAITQGQTLTVQIGNATETVTFGSASTEVNTLAELNTRLASAQTSFGTGTTVSADANGNLTVTSADTTSSITLGGTASLTTFGTNLTTTATAPTSGTPVNNAARAAAESQFNTLRTQIDQLASDASFNGNNLLNGDNLSVIFNSSSSSTLSVNGVNYSSTGLGITAAATDAFQTNTNVEATLTQLDTAISTLRTQGSTFGSNLTVVETRQNFTNSLINVLETGAGNLTLADTNQEGANLLALQTRQQLSSVSLSLASQADQSVLRLF